MPIVLTRATKLDARYKALGGAEHCSACRFYMPQGTCGRIIGPVSPEGWCKYYSREAVQRWSNPGYAGSGGGLPAGSTLNLNFMTPGTLDPLLTFTRASTATYFDATGTMQTAAANAPRWDYDPVTHALRGLLLEDARTNTVTQSGNLGIAPWAPAGNGASAAPTVTANNITAPDGTLSAARIVMPAVAAGANASFVYNTSGAGGGVQNTCSIWLRGAVGGETVNLFFTNFTTYFHSTLALTTAWRRLSVVGTPAAGGWAFGIGTDMRDATQTPNAAQTFYAWGAQVEAGAFPTSYIPTTAAAVTRAIDSCVIPSANMSPWFAPPGGSWFAEFDYFNATPVSSRIISRPNAASTTTVFINPTNNAGQYDGVSMSTTNPMNAGVINKVATTWAVGEAKVCTNGGTVVKSATLITGYGAFATTGVPFLTPAGPGNTDNTSGHIRRVSYWPRVLSDAEMQQVTT